jgi:hypothetical protein
MGSIGSDHDMVRAIAAEDAKFCAQPASTSKAIGDAAKRNASGEAQSAAPRSASRRPERIPVARAAAMRTKNTKRGSPSSSNIFGESAGSLEVYLNLAETGIGTMASMPGIDALFRS